jgi:hypothetical protein
MGRRAGGLGRKEGVGLCVEGEGERPAAAGPRGGERGDGLGRKGKEKKRKKSGPGPTREKGEKKKCIQMHLGREMHKTYSSLYLFLLNCY